MRWYLAGGMTGYPQSNFPAFFAAAKDLRSHGIDLVSPAELDDADTVARALADLPCQQSWADFLSRDVKLIADQVQGIIYLPDWQKSRGARLETFVGLLQGKDFKFAVYEPRGKTSAEVPIDPVPQIWVIDQIFRNMR
jgi:hypothetical protein